MKQLNTLEVKEVSGGLIFAGPVSFFVEALFGWGLGSLLSWGYHHPDEAWGFG